jgi:HEAT repeat protein
MTDTAAVRSSLQENVERAITRLKSLHDESGVVAVVGCGAAAIPALRDLLFTREPSGLFQVRCRAVEALTALRAHEVLSEFVRSDRVGADPVERLGDDAVINAAVRSFARLRRDNYTFYLLLRLAKRVSLSGVIEALGSFDRPEAIPLLIDALEDDASRPAAEAALRRIGLAARPALIATANFRTPTAELESESSLRRRRGALRLLKEIGVPRKTWPQLRALVRDRDTRISAVVSDICLAVAPARERRDAVHRLIEMLAHDDWMLRDQIEQCLVAHFDTASVAIAGYLKENALQDQADRVRRQIERSLRRIQRQANGLSSSHNPFIS